MSSPQEVQRLGLPWGITWNSRLPSSWQKISEWQGLRRPLSLPCAQGGSSAEVRPGCPGLHLDQTGLENSQGQRLHSLSGQPLSLPDSPKGEKASPYIQTESLDLIYAQCLSSSHYASLWKAWVHLHDALHVVTRGCSGLPRTVFSPGRESPAASVSPQKASVSALTILLILHWNFSKLLTSFLYLGTLTWTQYSGCGLLSAKEKERSLPSFC